jgi:hypothetical protein
MEPRLMLSPFSRWYRLTARELAMGMLRAQVPAEGPPTPRAQEYIDNGEWDSGALLALNFFPGGILHRPRRGD